MTNTQPAITRDGRPPETQTPRLMVSWLIVGLPLAYGVFQTIRSILPLFGG